MGKLLLTPEQAIELLPEGETVHTLANVGPTLFGTDWPREEIIEKINAENCVREIAGDTAREFGHALALYNNDTKWLSDVLFVETNMELVDRLYPPEKGTE